MLIPQRKRRILSRNNSLYKKVGDVVDHYLEHVLVSSIYPMQKNKFIQMQKSPPNHYFDGKSENRAVTDYQDNYSNEYVKLMID